jgi:hypothetical protein
MCMPGIKYNPNGYTPRDYAKEGYINKGPGLFGLTRWVKPETQSSPATQPSSIPQSSANSFMPAYSDQQQPIAQQQTQPSSMPRATTNRFSFNRGSLRIGDSTMSDSDTGLNI